MKEASIISPRALISCFSIVSHNNRAMEIPLHGNPVTTVLCCYSPNNKHSDEDVDQFYQEISTVIHAISPQSSDNWWRYECATRSSDALFTSATDTNRNGKYMKDFKEQYNLIATNTKFQNKKSKLWTYRRPNGQHVQLDWILARQKWTNSINNSRAYNTFEGIGSDHRIFSCKWEVSRQD